jgi:hypothetical protein
MENYFNYFTEIEEHFQRARGTGTFRLSPLDWALIEAWKESNIPLEAVLRGIDRTFEKWQARPRKGRLVNALAFCSQEVAGAAQEQSPGERQRATPAGSAPFTMPELAAQFAKHAATVRPQFPGIAASLDDLRQAAESGIAVDLEEVERRLTVLEDKMFSSLVSACPEQRLLALRRELDVALQPHRRKMSAEQIALLEKQYLRKALLESAGLPRLSLFHW